MGLYISPELECSKAWNDAGLYGQRLFYCLHNGIRYKRTKKNGVMFTNHDELAFTQAEFMEKYSCCKETYTSAKKQLIHVGLARITHHGGKGKNDFTKFKLCYLNDNPLPNNDMPRWKFYDGDKKNWGNEVQKSKHGIGKKHRFEKGKGGRKKISTLSKPTLNGTTTPIEIDTKKEQDEFTPY